MSDSSNPELGNTLALTHMVDTMRKGQLEIRYQGNLVQMVRKLGEGGTKTVYDAIINNSPWAVAIPNTTDGIQTMMQKWSAALKEPAHTERTRNLGFYVNPSCEALPVSLNGVSFNVIRMTRYQDLPYPILDGKDPRASTVQGDILPSDLDEIGFEELMSNVVPDIESLIRNGIRVGKDSISICLVDRKPRIFLSDLGDMKIEAFSEDRIPAVAREYTADAYSALVQGLTEDEYQRHKAFFGGEFFRYNNPNSLRNRLGVKIQQGFTGDTAVS